MQNRKQTGEFMKRSRLYRLNVEQKKINDRIYRKNTYLAVIILAILFSMFFTSAVYKWLNRPMLDPRGSTIIPQVVEVKAQEEKPYCKDAISCIRDIGESQGRSNKTIMIMIRIAQKESNMNPLAKNKRSSARGLFQIIAGTWYSNDCVGDKYDYENNITCAYKILDGQGLRAWEVCTKGSAKCY